MSPLTSAPKGKALARLLLFLDLSFMPEESVEDLQQKILYKSIYPYWWFRMFAFSKTKRAHRFGLCLSYAIGGALAATSTELFGVGSAIAGALVIIGLRYITVSTQHRLSSLRWQEVSFKGRCFPSMPIDTTTKIWALENSKVEGLEFTVRAIFDGSTLRSPFLYVSMKNGESKKEKYVIGSWKESSFSA